MSALGSLAAACEGEIARTNQDTEEAQSDTLLVNGSGGEDSASYREKPRTRQNFSWRQVSVLEQVFETDPLPRQALRIQLAQRLGISPRCVQVWFQNRRQKWKSQQQALGHNPPSLKSVSSRLNSLEELLPYASGADAQRVFAPSYSPGMLMARPMGWQAHALSGARGAGPREGGELPLGAADPAGAVAPTNPSLGIMAGASHVPHLPKYGAFAAGGAPNLVPMMGGSKRGREEGEEGEPGRPDQRARASYWGAVPGPPSSLEPNPAGAANHAAMPHAPYLSLDHPTSAPPPAPGHLPAGPPAQPAFRSAIMPPGAFPGSMVSMADGSLGWVVKDSSLTMDAARQGGLANGMAAAGGLEGVPGQPGASSSAVHAGISYLPYPVHPQGVQPHAYHIVGPPGAPHMGAPGMGAPSMGQPNMGAPNMAASIRAAGLQQPGHHVQPSIYVYQSPHMLPPRQ